MFESATLTAAPASTRLWSTCAGISGQALIVGCMLLAPLISPSVLPNLKSYILLTAPGPPPAPPPKGDIAVQPRLAHATRVFRCTFCAPVAIPDHVAKIVDEEPPMPVSDVVGVVGGDRFGQRDGVVGGVLNTLLTHTAAPPPKPVETVAAAKAPAPPVITRHRLGGNVKLAAPIYHPDPVYPQIAKIGRIEGVVELEGVVGIDGRIHDLKVKSGHPFLVKAAMDAVLQWRYTPGTLNGDPVEVIAPITVTFRLGAR